MIFFEQLVVILENIQFDLDLTEGKVLKKITHSLQKNPQKITESQQIFNFQFSKQFFNKIYTMPQSGDAYRLGDVPRGRRY